MADSATKSILSVCATIGSKLSDLSIKDGQLIFVHDKHKLALDFGGKRVFYNQIEELATDEDRKVILAPVTGRYYFVINTAVLWTYQNGWVQITTPPEEILFIGTELPELGTANKLYVDKFKQNISIWNEETNSYMVVGEKYDAIGESDIDSLFA